MSLQVTSLNHNRELVELSIDEQDEINGGFTKADNYYYQESLSAYAKGNAAISSEGDAITFESNNVNYTNPLPLFETVANRPGGSTAKPTQASFQVKGNEITLLPLQQS
jgi:hypothetical protein